MTGRESYHLLLNQDIFDILIILFQFNYNINEFLHLYLNQESPYHPNLIVICPHKSYKYKIPLRKKRGKQPLITP